MSVRTIDEMFIEQYRKITKEMKRYYHHTVYIIKLINNMLFYNFII